MLDRDDGQPWGINEAFQIKQGSMGHAHCMQPHRHDGPHLDCSLTKLGAVTQTCRRRTVWPARQRTRVTYNAVITSLCPFRIASVVRLLAAASSQL